MIAFFCSALVLGIVWQFNREQHRNILVLQARIEALERQLAER